MKKHTVIFMVFTFSAFCEQSLFAQCSNGNTHDALDTYWHYRYRLINYFMQVGEGTWDNNIPQGGFGQSIPAYIRNYDAGNEGCGGGMWWSDAGRNLGYYISTLATEYYLLYNNGQNTNQTAMELFYALHAVFRLDSIGLVNWAGFDGTIDPSIIPNVQVANPIINFPGKGYMEQDDVPSDFYNNINGNISALPNYSGCGENGSGIVGPVSSVSSGWVNNNWGGATSEDNYYALLMGLAITVKTLQNLPAITSFYDANGNPVNFASQPYYSDLCSMARELGGAIMSYLINCQYQPKTPDGANLASSNGGIFCQPLEEIGDAYFGFSNLSSVPCPGIVLWGSIKWNNYTLCNLIESYYWAFNFNCNFLSANIEMPCELAALSNDGGPYGEGDYNACQYIEALGNYPQILVV